MHGCVEIFYDSFEWFQHVTGLSTGPAVRLLLLAVFCALIAGAWLLYITLYLVAPVPRPPLAIERKYRSLDADGNVSGYEKLPCWQDGFDEKKRARQWMRKQKESAQLKYNASHKPAAQHGSSDSITSLGNAGLPGVDDGDIEIEPAALEMSLVVPAFNESDRIGVMLQEAVETLELMYSAKVSPRSQGRIREDDSIGALRQRHVTDGSHIADSKTKDYEIIIVSDGSADTTVSTTLQFAKSQAPDIASRIRVIELQRNRGKGGAVIHGMRHVRGHFVVFADADGASKFADLGKLVEGCRKVSDAKGRAVAVGSRAHLVGSDAVIKRSVLRNFLMHSFHLLLRFLTPPATAAIGDTQCGFKLFSRPSLPFIVPFMHSEGWIFDVEMLMLAESAGIPVVEVPVGWKEVTGSKLNVLWDSLGMAYGLAILRLAWALGIYSTEI